MNEESTPILEIRDLQAGFETDNGFLKAVDGVSFAIPKGKTVGLVGESGCGKSVTAMSIIRLLPQPSGKIVGGEISFLGRDLTQISDQEMRKIRGGEIGVIFQEPMTALNPVHRIGKQLTEAMNLHPDQIHLNPAERLERAIHLLKRVGIPKPESRLNAYPHQMSGGQRQRVMIAMALSCHPKLLIADEPTTALDVTVQAQILELLNDLQNEYGMSILMITHDLGVVAESCDEVAVMYAGRIVEKAPASQLFSNPRHAYTQGLLHSIPTFERPRKSALPTIPGLVPALKDLPVGSRFARRSGRPWLPEHEATRPPFVQIAENHWVENCPVCVQDEFGKPLPALSSVA